MKDFQNLNMIASFEAEMVAIGMHPFLQMDRVMDNLVTKIQKSHGPTKSTIKIE